MCCNYCYIDSNVNLLGPASFGIGLWGMQVGAIGGDSGVGRVVAWEGA